MDEVELTQAFDTSASSYDSGFTGTPIGKLQRKRIRNYLRAYFEIRKGPLRILELNCGTGEDAIWLANQGHDVLAVDISSEMIKVANKKGASKRCKGQLHFETADIRSIDKHVGGEAFDLVFSNFGGLNCLSSKEISDLSFQLQDLLSEQASIILVVMPKKCFVEDLYLFSHMDFAQIGRRNGNTKLPVSVGGFEVATWYHSPKAMQHIFDDERIVTSHIFAVGFTPSYLNPFFRHKRVLFFMWALLGRFFSCIRPTANYADHYLIHFERK